VGLSAGLDATEYFKYCDRFDGTSDMNAATQRPSTDSGVSYATVFRIHGTEKYKSIATQRIRRPSLGNDSVNHA
jgi:hypothetical protein